MTSAATTASPRCRSPIPAYGSHVSLFTILMAVSTVIYSVITTKQMPQQQGMPSMKLMMYLFPVMMLFFMNSLPAGLSYYYLLANLISILQMTVLSHFFIDEKQLRLELEKNMSTPRKKSKWAAAHGGDPEAIAAGFAQALIATHVGVHP